MQLTLSGMSVTRAGGSAPIGYLHSLISFSRPPWKVYAITLFLILWTDKDTELRKDNHVPSDGTDHKGQRKDGLTLLMPLIVTFTAWGGG